VPVEQALRELKRQFRDGLRLQGVDCLWEGYSLLEGLGSGGFATAWRGRDEEATRRLRDERKGEDERRPPVAVASTDEAREATQQPAHDVARVPAAVREPMRRTEGPSGTTREFVNSIGMRFVLVKPGKFLMGSPADETQRGSDEHQHEVTITRAFYLGVHPVTQGQWKRVMGDNPAHFSCGGNVRDNDLDRFPVESVSWEDAQEFLKKLAALSEEAKSRWGYRLPSEAEWEFACRGGADSSPLPFHFDQPSASLSSTQANFAGNPPYGGAASGPSLRRPSKVGSYEPNRLGLYDMHGNVWEWCHDWYGLYPSSPATDPPGPADGSDRVVRGGSWSDDGRNCRAAVRVKGAPSFRNYDLGFRAAAVPLG
jgi:formylglycine-generating enzyme required for sulfatase activity